MVRRSNQLMMPAKEDMLNKLDALHQKHVVNPRLYFCHDKNATVAPG